MKKILITVLLCVVHKWGIGQNLATSFYKPGVTNFNDFLYLSFKENPAMKNADTICIESCSFVKFSVAGKKIVTTVYSKFTPSVIIETIEKSFAKTNGYWLDEDTTVYLLPIVYVFENNCKPANRSSISVLQILKDLSGHSEKPSFPGSATEIPLKCILLNPFLLKYM